MCDNCVKSYSSWNAFFCWLAAFGYSNNQREATLLQNVKLKKLTNVAFVIADPFYKTIWAGVPPLM
jgi:hypothetical protein